MSWYINLPWWVRCCQRTMSPERSPKLSSRTKSSGVDLLHIKSISSNTPWGLLLTGPLRQGTSYRSQMALPVVRALAGKAWHIWFTNTIVTQVFTFGCAKMNTCKIMARFIDAFALHICCWLNHVFCSVWTPDFPATLNKTTLFNLKPEARGFCCTPCALHCKCLQLSASVMVQFYRIATPQTFKT